MLPAVTAFRSFQARRRLTTRVNDRHEKLDKIENGLFAQALIEMNLIADDANFDRVTRRNKIFRAFSAKDYLNSITRESIVRALSNIK